MIVLVHKDNEVVSVFDYHSKKALDFSDGNLVATFFEIAKTHKNTIIIWCHDDLKNDINIDELKESFHHKLIMSSFEASNTNYIDDRIGYVESSPFIKINKSVNYPTWLMSSKIGAVNTDVINNYDVNNYIKRTLDYTLNSIAKNGIINGLFCYSNPKILKPNKVVVNDNNPSVYELFIFIREHYRRRWALLTLFNILIYEKRLLLLPFLVSFFSFKKLIKPNFKNIEVKPNSLVSKKHSVDVIIPTIGRREFLYDVLKDLSDQTILPKNVIIIEQNLDVRSNSELDYIKDELWPFKIKHKFINQTGACNARNLALSLIESDWVFMADDDIRFEHQMLEFALNEMMSFGLNAATISCLRQGDEEKKKRTLQWNTFGSGCSIISKQIASKIKFDMAYEHGFGEDGDFGMQIRNLGEDICYMSKSSILHLKAPIGGFRTKITHPWDTDEIQPKPSPTIMLFNIKNQSPFQIKGYKTILFFKFFKLQSNKNPITYFFDMKKRWIKSMYLAYQLKTSSKK
jgi:glycosyltransferase involved in cell wall biosynthesis